MPRFVILRHQTPPASDRPLHWDLLLEAGPVLRAWALLQQPAAEVTIPAQQLPDHRLVYLDYEGPISGGRGVVSRWDSGTYELVAEDDESVVLQLMGHRLCGRGSLRRQPGTEAQWTFRLARD